MRRPSVQSTSPLTHPLTHQSRFHYSLYILHLHPSMHLHLLLHPPLLPLSPTVHPNSSPLLLLSAVLSSLMLPSPLSLSTTSPAVPSHPSTSSHSLSPPHLNSSLKCWITPPPSFLSSIPKSPLLLSLLPHPCQTFLHLFLLPSPLSNLKKNSV